tara:strand:- start:88 stop:339 length:252 start_codon:yes stop_codon:yes gene_type:complete
MRIVNPGDLVRWWFTEYVPSDVHVSFDDHRYGIVIKVVTDDGVAFLRENGEMVKNEKRASVLWQDGSISWIPCIELKVINESR